MLRRLGLSFLVILTFLFAGCGEDSLATGGGGGAQNVVRGVVLLGPLQGGRVRIFALRTDLSSGLLLGSGTTADDGSYAVSISEIPEIGIRIEVTGGSYVSEFDGTRVNLTTPLSTILLTDQLNRHLNGNGVARQVMGRGIFDSLIEIVSVPINALTTAFDHVARGLGLRGTPPEEAFNQANQTVSPLAETPDSVLVTEIATSPNPTGLRDPSGDPLSLQNTVILPDGTATIVSNDGAGIVANDGAGIVAGGGLNILSHNGNALIGQDANNFIPTTNLRVMNFVAVSDATNQQLNVELSAEGTAALEAIFTDLEDGVLDGKLNGQDIPVGTGVLPRDILARLLANYDQLATQLQAGNPTVFVGFVGLLQGLNADLTTPVAEVVRRLANSSLNPLILIQIVLTPDNQTLNIGDLLQFQAVGIFRDPDDPNNQPQANLTTSVTWNSTNPAAATINNRGLATAVSGLASTMIEASFLQGGTLTTASVSLNVNAPPVAPGGGQLYVADSGTDTIHRFSFDPASGAVTIGTPVASATADPFDLLITRDKRFLISSTNGGVDVYSLNASGSPTLMQTNVLGQGVRNLYESLLAGPGGTIRIFAIKFAPPSEIWILSLNPANGAITVDKTIPFPGAFPFDLASAQDLSSPEYLFVSDNSNNVFAFEVPAAIPAVVANQMFTLPVATQLAELEVGSPAGPVLQVLDLTAAQLNSIKVNVAAGLAGVLDIAGAAQVATQTRPQGLSVDATVDDLAYFGSEGTTSVDGFQLAGPPT
ncbi:MAG: hypothetical protein AB1758_30295, partial [Candidatus Eremiobacterota bacterium]